MRMRGANTERTGCGYAHGRRMTHPVFSLEKPMKKHLEVIHRTFKSHLCSCPGCPNIGIPVGNSCVCEVHVDNVLGREDTYRLYFCSWECYNTYDTEKLLREGEQTHAQRY